MPGSGMISRDALPTQRGPAPFLSERTHRMGGLYAHPGQSPRSSGVFFGPLAETIVDNGYTVVPVLPGTKKPRFQNWQKGCFADTDPAFLARHVAKYPGDSVGLACGSKIIGIDIDATDPQRAAELQHLATEMLGDTPLLRIGELPKRLLVYRAGERINTVTGAGVEVR
jgi:hypothetical protein